MIIILLLLSSFNSYCQLLTQSEFNKINNHVRELWFSIKSDEDFPVLIEKLNIQSKDAAYLEELQKEKNLIFHEGLDEKDHLMPFYQKSEYNDKLLLTFYASILTIDNGRKDLSELGWADYHFVLESLVGLDGKGNIVFGNTQLKSTKKEIRDWYLFIHRFYLTNTKPIHEKYGFVPPPPPSIPEQLEHSPYHLAHSMQKHIESEKWKEAKVFVNKLIIYYPEDSNLFKIRALIYMEMRQKENSCKDFERAIELGILEKPGHEISITMLQKYCNE